VGWTFLRGLYSQGEVRTTTLTGCSLADTALILGFDGPTEMVHRDNLDVGPE
jgi:hypothetical protein